MATVKISAPIDRGGKEIGIFIENQFDPAIEASIIREALKDAAKTFAKEWIEENNDKILKRLNVDAIANMIMLEVASQTKDNILEKKLKK